MAGRMAVNARRVRMIYEPPSAIAPPTKGKGTGAVVYWMSRDQRVQDNWALLYAQEVAAARKVPMAVVFNLVSDFPGANLRHYHFMMQGLAELEQELRQLSVPFFLLQGDPARTVPDFAERNGASLLVMDFSPLRIGQVWRKQLSSALQKQLPACTLAEVDAHNIVPCWVASDKKEYGARTIRRKINDKLPEFLTEFPPVVAPVVPWPASSPDQPAESIDWTGMLDAMTGLDRTVGVVDWCTPGAAAARDNLNTFLDRRIKIFADKRNDPCEKALSNVSPWLHYGQISAQRCALEAKRIKKRHSAAVDSFLEELIVRRELSDNFCYYDPAYDDLFTNKYDWCVQTLKAHAADKRPATYTREQMEKAQTKDDLWNAAQQEMVLTGKMHGFLRMYWAKKILEWTGPEEVEEGSSPPQRALATAIYLNDKYSLDGRDPNGYVGCQWAIGGLHDQGWQERPVFGKIRYMNYKGCQRKFDVSAYVRRIRDLGGETASGSSSTNHTAVSAKAAKKQKKKLLMPAVGAPPKKKAKKVKAKAIDLF